MRSALCSEHENGNGNGNRYGNGHGLVLEISFLCSKTEEGREIGNN